MMTENDPSASAANVSIAPHTKAGSAGGIAANFTGGGSAIPAGLTGCFRVPYAMTLNQASLLADKSGSIVIGIWKGAGANFPPTDADSITGSTPPTISAGMEFQDTALTGWTTSMAAGDILYFNVISCSAIARCELQLRGARL